MFLLVVIASAILGGFVGGELADRTFLLGGAVIGGVGVAAVLLGLGAYFDSQERKRPKGQVELTPEIRGVFDRMLKNPEIQARLEAKLAGRAVNDDVVGRARQAMEQIAGGLPGFEFVSSD